jgi:hypothetical protein
MGQGRRNQQPAAEKGAAPALRPTTEENDTLQNPRGPPGYNPTSGTKKYKLGRGLRAHYRRAILLTQRHSVSLLSGIFCLGESAGICRLRGIGPSYEAVRFSR